MKLDICGGNTKIYKDFLNVDGTPGPRVDIVADIKKPLPFKDFEVEEILSVATLEHLLISQTDRLLKEFNRILQPGGKLTIGVPDLKKICFAYVEETESFKMINGYIYGELTEEMNMDFFCHKSAYDFRALEALLKRSGFINIKEVDYDFPMHRKQLMIKVICEKPL
jgi:predicted SAM-dependent methyltransferase